MKNLAVARRYAKALLLIGKESANAEVYRDELCKFSDLIQKEKNLKFVISNPLYNTDNRRNLLIKLIEKLGLSNIMMSFLVLLFDKGRLKYLNDIKEFYQEFADELKEIVRGSLTTASELLPETIDAIRDKLSKKIGKSVILEVKQDPGIIGGLITKIGDLVMDGSVKTQLLNMKESLKKGEGV